MKGRAVAILTVLCLMMSGCGGGAKTNPEDGKDASSALTAHKADEAAHQSLTGPAAVSDEHAGKAVFSRCAACHLPTGAGVPGAYPPLDDHIVDFASTKAGRDYLIMVVQSGLIGAIKVHEQNFAGAMPAQGSALRPDQIADVLNFVVKDLNGRAAGSAIQNFTAEEVEAAARKYSAISAADKLALRQSALETSKK